MNSIQKRWLLILTIFGAGDFVTNIFTNLYLWQQSSSLITIAIYNIAIFISIPVAALTGCFVTHFKDIKKTYYLAISFYILQLLTLIFLKESVLTILIPFGVISGLSIGFQSYTYNLITEEVTNEKREKFFGLRASLQNFLSLLLPPLYSFYISKTGSYNSLFIFALALFIFLLVVFYLFPFKKQATPFLLIKAASVPGTNPDKLYIFWLKLLQGFESGLTWSVTSVILLSLLTEIVKWGIYSTLLSLISIVGCFIYGSRVNIRQSRLFFTIWGLVYAFACITLVTNFSLISFLFFLLVNTVMGIIMSVNYDAIINYLIEEDTSSIDLKKEYHAILEIPLAIGRILPLLFILILGIHNPGNVLLRLVFLILAPVPLYMMVVFFKTRLNRGFSL